MRREGYNALRDVVLRKETLLIFSQVRKSRLYSLTLWPSYNQSSVALLGSQSYISLLVIMSLNTARKFSSLKKVLWLELLKTFFWKKITEVSLCVCFHVTKQDMCKPQIAIHLQEVGMGVNPGHRGCNALPLLLLYRRCEERCQLDLHQGMSRG